MSVIDFIAGESVQVPAENWDKNPKSYRAHVLLIPEDDGTVSAAVVNLPGVGSCGDSEEEAIANVREAFAAAVESYLEAGKKIPWRDATNDDVNDKRCIWIVVHV